MAQFNLHDMSADRNDDTYCSSWKRLYQEAVWETDRGKIRIRITHAQIAVLKRSTELVSRPAGREHQELNDAWRFLHLLESEAMKEQEIT